MILNEHKSEYSHHPVAEINKNIEIKSIHGTYIYQLIPSRLSHDYNSGSSCQSPIGSAMVSHATLQNY